MSTRNQTKIKTVLTLAALALVMLAASTNAAIVVEEQFIYEPAEANIDGQNGGIGFDGAWVSTISHGRIYWIHSPGLSFTDVNSSELPVAGNALSRYGSAGRAQAHRLLSGASKAALTGDNTTIWFSALFQEPANQYRHGTFLFGTDALTTAGTPTLAAAGDGFGFTLQSAPDGASQGSGTINAIAYDNSTTPTIVEGTYTPNPITATSLIVGKINWKPDGAPDELYLFNITDMSAEPAEGTAIASITNLDFNQSAFDTVAMWDSNNAITDEIRFGNTFVEALGKTLIDPNAPSVDAGDDWITWSGEPVTANATVVNNDPDEPQADLTYAWTVDTASLADANLTIELTNADQEDVTVKITKTADTGDATVVTMTLAGNNAGSGKPAVEDTMTIDVYDNACLAAIGKGLDPIGPADFDENCITNLRDYAVLAAKWLVDYTLIAPVAKP